MSPDPAIEAVVDRVAELLRQRVGLRPDSSLRGRLRRSIRDEATAHGQDLNAYPNTLITRAGAVQSLINQVTVQETSFFRHPEHFHVMDRDILPNLAQPVTIWSAGCANGQEAFSLAMLLQERRIKGSVIATDLSTSALRRTTAAHYTTRELTGLSPDRIALHLTKTNHGWRINENIRNRVTALPHNLVEPILEQVRGCQVVFCRNVLIYFSPDHARTFLDRVADALPTATVFLGAAETMWSVSDRYETVRVDDTFYYRQRAPGALRAKQPSSRPPTAQTNHGRGAGSHPPPVRTSTDPHRASTARGRTGRTSTPAPPLTAPVPTLAAPENDTVEAAALARAGQQALDNGDHRSAVVAFRKCAYLTPDDALAHLHLGLALEASGDIPSARRAFGTARRTILKGPAAQAEHALGGYATTELLRLLDTKRHVLAP
jgi:chemotaxis methyl-accepting protein methylase